MTQRAPLTVGFFVTPDFILLDLGGAMEPFHLANWLGSERYRIRVLSASGGMVRSSEGVMVGSERAEFDGLDTLFVIGGEGAVLHPIPVEQTRIVRAAYDDGIRRVASVCVGAFILAAAGLLDGRRATTHWMYAPELQRRHPRVQVDGDRIFTRDDRIWTSAGITAGIDLALSLIEEDLGKTVARTVARQLVVYHRRAGGQMQFSSLLRLDPDSDRMRRVMSFMRENLEHSLPLERLADIANLSVRQFGRAFFKATGTTPAKLVERLRVEAAKPRIEEGRESLDIVARSVGFTDTDRMRLAFLRVLGQTPRVLRKAGSGSKLDGPGVAPMTPAVRAAQRVN
ncbi:GlxA family transcriptional regulator [Panacagrimonas sp.]|uniref:GlxA family transcriptional regulator n=1 Tax=Panacagrimonas sp. TaxID=2480088 RepID=UPI003B52360D